MSRLLTVAGLVLAYGTPALALNYNVRKVDLDPNKNVAKAVVTGGPNVLTTLVFPEEVSDAKCGTCTEEETGNVDELWFLRISEDRTRVHVRPTRLPTFGLKPRAFKTTLQVVLAGGYRINATLRHVPALTGKYSSVDQEVRFTLPQRALYSGKIAIEAQRLRKDYETKLETAGLENALGMLLGKLKCESFWGRPHRDERVVVRLKQRCRARGEAQSYWVVFEVENLDALPLNLRAASLQPSGSFGQTMQGTGMSASPGAADLGAEKNAQNAPLSGHRFATSNLMFNTSTLGIALAQWKADEPPKTWELVIQDDANDAGIITVKDIVF